MIKNRFYLLIILQLCTISAIITTVASSIPGNTVVKIPCFTQGVLSHSFTHSFIHSFTRHELSHSFIHSSIPGNTVVKIPCFTQGAFAQHCTDACTNHGSNWQCEDSFLRRANIFTDSTEKYSTILSALSNNTLTCSSYHHSVTWWAAPNYSHNTKKCAYKLSYSRTEFEDFINSLIYSFTLNIILSICVLKFRVHLAHIGI